MSAKLPVLADLPEVVVPEDVAAMTPDELENNIRRLKKERNAVILAHYYQESEIQDLADFVGDSLQLSQAAAKTKAAKPKSTTTTGSPNLRSTGSIGSSRWRIIL